ncbi:MAG: methyl-accepting chemotaxis protein, partial [Treponema sp.]|nr:methyl-accepting chemotaxis protein [Treponema sp.]
MKIGIKLVVVISIINLIGIGLLAGVTLIQSQREISRMANEHAIDLAVQGGEKITSWFGDYIVAVRAVAQAMEAYQEIPAPVRRDYFNTALKQVYLANPELTSVYANWAPNMLDGMDTEYANSQGTDASGRYIPAWAKRDGELFLTPILGFDWDMIKQMPLFGEEYMIDPTVYTGIDGKISLIANMGAPIRDNSALIGVAGCVLELSTIQAIAEEIKPFGDGFIFVFSSGGLIAAHPDPERLGKNIRESETDTFGPLLDTMVDAVTKGTATSFSYQPPQSDTVMQYYAVPFTIGQVPLPWTLVVGVSRNTIMAPVYRMLTICLIIGVLTILLVFIGAIFIARSVSRPIAYTMTVLKDIAEGDLTKEIAVSSKDEVGDLARYLNFTVDKINSLVLSIRHEADSLSQTGTELAANTTQTAASITEITASVQSVKGQTG